MDLTFSLNLSVGHSTQDILSTIVEDQGDGLPQAVEGLLFGSPLAVRTGNLGEICELTVALDYGQVEST